MADDSFIVFDSDEDALSPDNSIENRENVIIPDSDAEFDENEEDVPEGRLTPSIRKAIRRSIFNMSHVADSDEEDEDDDEMSEDEVQKSLEKSRRLYLSDSESEEESSFIQERKKRQNRIVDSSDEETEARRSLPSRFEGLLDTSNEQESTSVVTSPTAITSKHRDTSSRSISTLDSSKISRSPTRSPHRPQTSSDSLVIESSSNDETSPGSVRKSISKSKQSKEVISIDSDSPTENSQLQDRSAGEVTALTIAQEELGLNNIDPLMAQRRALLVIELQKKESELAKMDLFIQSGKHQLLPDGGKKLLDTAAETSSEILRIRKEISECRLVERDPPSPRSTSLSPEVIPRGVSVNPVAQRFPPAPSRRSSDPVFIPSDSDSENPTPPENPRLLNRPTTAPIGELGKKALETFEREQALTIETLETFHGSLISRPGEDELADDPRGLKVPLMNHQKHALAWLMWREHQNPPGGVLADDMGLGKTLTMISLVLKTMQCEYTDGDSDEGSSSNLRSLKPLGGTLVVCPASLIGQWDGEVNRRCKKGLLNVELYHGTKREKAPRRLARNDMVITTYNLLSREHKADGVLFRIDWKRVILDEGHVIRNHKSQVCEAVCDLTSRRRWVLSGTPIHNKEMDLFSVLKFLKCSPFNDIRVWKRWVDNKNQAGHDRLATVMKTLMLRRTKQELMNSGAVENLPEKSTEIIWVKLDPEEKIVYEKVMLYSKTIFAQFLHQRAEKEHMFKMGAGLYDRPRAVNKNPFNKAQQKLLAQHADVKSHQILTLFLRLRQICCHPSLIDAMLDQEDIEQTGFDEGEGLAQRMASIRLDVDEEAPDGPSEVDDRVSGNLLTSDNPVFERSRQSSKMRAVLELLQSILEKEEKVIIVSQWTSVLDIIAENLQKIRVPYNSLTGAVMVKDRGAIVDSFNHDKEPKVLLLSLTAGGVGLNLVGANHLMLVDIHWNPQLESQAQDRIYRFGQKRNVFIYKFLCSDTIEEKIKNMQEDKLELAKTLLSGGGRAKAAKLTMDDLKTIFGL
ncbi:transcription termination factor 2 [Fopius arisanus]|uniref:Transcription termination factor 2 n=2 Tax=Fopius arisanus TaxID=64838 RepID=A0A9R1TTU1_9HYME|nr:PREDICTED: transcription termination factor 2 [Fopius arisanus]